MTQMTQIFRVAAVAVFLAQPAVTMSDAWMPPPAAGATSTTLYATIKNPTMYRRLRGVGHVGGGGDGGVA